MAMEQIHIPVILSSDNNQVNAMAVVMTSAIETAGEGTYYDFYCFLSDNVTEENRERLLKCRENSRKNCSVTLVDMSKYFDNNAIQYSGKVGMVHSVTTPALYRLKAPSVLSHLDKVLYLDTDTMVRTDLRELFEFIKTKYPEVPESIKTDKEIKEETEQKLLKAIEDFKAEFK